MSEEADFVTELPAVSLLGLRDHSVGIVDNVNCFMKDDVFEIFLLLSLLSL